ncbi:MAG: HAMP domain-containing protein [Actinophytocola sp.]|nr:HAMP domain-containing protein [Actinophytocola sp.]
MNTEKDLSVPLSATGDPGGAQRHAAAARSAPVGGRFRGSLRRVMRPGSGEEDGRWRLRNWTLRSKLVAVLLIPTLTALVLIGMRFNTQVASAERLAELSARISTDTAVAGLVHVLQRERDMTVRYIAEGRGGNDRELTKQRGRVDRELGGFNQALNDARPELSPGPTKRFEQLQQRLENLTRLRYGAEHAAYPADAVLRSYSELISSLLSAREQSVATINEPELVRLQLAGSALSRVKDQMSVTRALVAEALATGELVPDRRRLLGAANAEADAWRTDFRKFASAAQQQMYDDTVTGLIVDNRNRILESVMVRAENGRAFSQLAPAEWETAATYTANLARDVEEAMLVQMQQRTDELASAAGNSAMRDGAIVVGLLLLAVLLAIVIARSLLRPLRILRSTALEVAEYRLPAAVHGLLVDPGGVRPTDVAPVPVTSNEEVGQVARAFDAVHGEAIRLAAEQAELRKNVNSMFLNLSRRGQELADRQLDLLDRMEAEEQDPDTLAALFELDHLATRSRRICENLLVLTGNDFARMMPGAVAASEVLGAALSEIEQYQRVEIASAPEIAVRGDAASDVVHVISELLENATNGSAPDTTVSVFSAMRKGGTWLVEITDHGPGMSKTAIDSANARLAELPEIDVEASRRMGLYVVARLAQRNGLEVKLRPAATGGLTASMLVPAALLGELPADAKQRPSAEPGRRPEWLETTSRRTDRPSPPLALVPAAPAPPRRAPVVAERAAVDGAVVGSHPLDDDQPTERLPVYRDLLTKWFTAVDAPGHHNSEKPSPDAHGNTHERPGAEERDAPISVPPWQESRNGGQARSVPEPEPSVQPDVPDVMAQLPTVRSLRPVGAANGVNSIELPAGVAREFAPPSHGELDLHGEESAPGAGGPAEVDHDLFDLVRTAVTTRRTRRSKPLGTDMISRSPEAVRSRMISLADGRRRARQSRADEYADPVQTSASSRAAVGAKQLGWPDERVGYGGKEG